MISSPFDLRLVPAAATSWAVAAWCVEQSSRWSLVMAGVCALIALALPRASVVVTASLVGVVALSCTWQVALIESSPLRSWAEDAVEVTAVVTISVDARTYRAPHGDGVVLTGQVPWAKSRYGQVLDGGSVTVFAESDVGQTTSEELTVGRRVRVTGRLSVSDDSDTVATMHARDIEVIGAGPWWWSMSEHVREGVRRSVAHQNADSRALVPALVDGDTSAIPDDLDDAFRRSGLTHLLAVSGTNLTIVVAAVLGVARAVGLRRRWWVGLGVMSVVGFVLVARPEPSVLRAAVMGLVALVALGRGQSGGLRALSWAVVVLLAIDPWLGRSPGFVLSVCATAGIIVVAPPLIERMTWCPRWMAIVIAVPLAAQIAVTPPLVALSGEISLVAVLANMAAGPAVAPTTVAGLVAGLTTLVTPELGSWIGTIAAWCARWIVVVGRTCGDWEGASIGWSTGPWWWSIPIVPAAIVLCWWLLRRPAATAAAVIALTVMVWNPPTPGWPPPQWAVVACDVGQGDALVVNSGQEGSAVVIDLGLDPPLIDQCLRRLGVDHIAALVLTHADADHVAGWSGVLDDRDVGLVVTGPTGGPDIPGVPRRQAASGDTVQIGSVRLEVLWPREREPTGASEDRNDLSLVMRYEVDGLRFLFTGDIEPEAQGALTRSGIDLRADILKVPHHGSAHQDEGFIEATQARGALISVGADNTYGHPASSVLDLLDDLGVSWWRTDLQGDIAVCVNDGRWTVVTRR